MNPPLPTFTHLGKTVILRPGSRLEKNELNSRLHQMDVQYDQSSLSKKYFIDLYENALKYDVNKIKIFDRLLKDTIYYEQLTKQKINNNEYNFESPIKINKNQKIAIIQNNRANNVDFRNNQNNNSRISIETNNTNNISNNNNSYNNTSNYNNNDYSNIPQKQNDNWNDNSYNDNNKNNTQFSFKDIIANEIKKNQVMIKNKNDNYNNNLTNDVNSKNEPNYRKYKQNINININPNDNNYMNNKNINNYNNNNQQQRYNYNEIQTNYDNNQNQIYFNDNYIQNQKNYYNNDIHNQNQQNYHTEYNNQKQQNYNTKYNQNQVNYNKDIPNYNHPNFNNQKQHNNYEDDEINNFPQVNNRYEKNNNYTQTNNQSNNMNYSKYERKNCIINQKDEINNNYNQFQRPNNNINPISLSIKNAIKDNNNYNNNQYEQNNIQRNYNNQNRRPFLSNNNNIIQEESEEEDVESNYTFKSKFDRIKNYFNDKENRDFFINILQMVIIGTILFLFFRYCIRHSATIGEKISETAKTMANPKKLFIDLILGIIKGIIVGIFWNNIYIILPLALISLVAYLLKKKFDFEDTCKKIIDDIKNDLRNGPLDNNGNRTITENEIIKRYSQKYNIDHNTFVKKYLKRLKILRRKEHSLKESDMKNNQGVTITTWELTGIN